MKNFIILLLLLLSINGFAQNNRKIYVTGSVYAHSTHMGLIGAKIYLIDSKGCTVDSVIAKTSSFYGNSVIEIPQFSLSIPYSAETYTLEATYPDYETGIAVLDMTKLGKRENSYKIPPFNLKRAPKQLGEVTVTASVVKFYNKGDTLVFNANAFDLADGSMLDALIRQLPGVELKDNGQIYVNGKFVESLMLNGRDFMGNNNQLLLDNLGAYTVKDVAVYDKVSRREEFLGKNLGESVYVMDVRMKKEFLGTYILNVEGGWGTSNRYLGRMFAMRSAATSQITIAANINNLNDNRRPGQNYDWKPEDMQSGNHKEKHFRADYNFNAPDRSWSFRGNTIVKHSSFDDDIYTDRISFLPSADNYGYSFRGNRSKNLWIGTAGNFDRTYSSMMLLGDFTLQYIDLKNKNSIVSATFNNEQINVTRSLLENLYTSAAVSLGTIVNRNLQLDSTANRTFRVYGNISPIIKIPHTSDDMVLNINADYTHERPTRLNEQMINFGDNPMPAVGTSQYFKNHPLHTLKLGASMQYTYWFRGGYFQPRYSLEYTDKEKDSRLYELEHLSDLGIHATIPNDLDGYYNGENSYFGTHRDLKHSLRLPIAFPIGKLRAQIAPTFNFVHQSLDYSQSGLHVKKSRNSMYISAAMSHIKYNIGQYLNDMDMPAFQHSFDLELKASGKTPDMTWLVDIPYTADPLNIAVGTDKLKNEQSYGASLTYKFSPKGSRTIETLIASYDRIDNALVRGFRYDSATGVRTIRSYNLSGNWTAGLQNIISTTLRKVTISSNTGLNLGRTADMIGRDSEPTTYAIRNLVLSEILSMQYSPVRWIALTAKTDVKWRRTTSNQNGFSTISALTTATGVTALFKLPLRFQISTDATLYARRGYGSSQLNTTDWVWNARLIWTTRNQKWLFAIDGFDLLKQLSSVVYDVNAQGRTVTYNNVLPRYLMLHIQYKINILPKKK